MLAAMRRVALALSALSAALVPAGSALAQDDGELRLMAEPHSYVDVVDAFDDDDPFDLNVTVGYRNRYQFGNIQREDNASAADPNRATRNWRDIAHHTHTQNILDVGLDVGIFRDLALWARMPIILSDDRSLGTASSARGYDANDFLRADADGDGDPTNDDPLFRVPFNSPTRSGLDYVEVGLAWSIFNQHRERELPTWVLLISGRLNVGDPMIACDGTSGTSCRQWTSSGDDWTRRDGGSDAGESRGTNALRIETRASWRTRYVEPYGGLLFGIEWPGSSERFFLPAGNIRGFINEQPPIIGQLTGGLAVIPWEDRGGFQRFAIDLRFTGRYVSEGHGYSPLFDALGTSNSPYLTELNLEGAPHPYSDTLNPGLRRVPFFGLTDMQQHAELGSRLMLEMRAARYVRFQLAAGLWYISPYVITYADACNPNVTPNPVTPQPGADGLPGTADDVIDPRMGTCRRGIINPHHRAAIDLPGNTFRVDEQIRTEISVSVTGMF